MFILVFFITILILVLIHEWGHFYAAKRFGIKVLEFGFGLPPRLFGKKYGETIYSLNWLPFGGFVRLFGEDETDKEVLGNERSFAAQVPWKKIVVVIAGVVMNLLLAWVLFYIILFSQNFKFELPLLSDYRFIGVTQTNDNLVLIGNVSPASPAETAGIKSGDRVISINNQSVNSGEELTEKIKSQAGQKIVLSISDIQKTKFRSVEVTPRENPPEGQGALGISIGSLKVANLEYKELWQKALSGPIHGINLTGYSFALLGETISKSISSNDLAPVSNSVAGPVGITSIVRDILATDDPFLPYLNFMAMLSLNLAIVNILPFPGLDGGRLVFLLFEAFTRKKAHPAIEKYIHTAGLLFLIALIVLVTASDIKKLIP